MVLEGFDSTGSTAGAGGDVLGWRGEASLLGCRWGRVEEPPRGLVRGRGWAGDAMGNMGWKEARLDAPLFPGPGFFPVLQDFHPFLVGTQRGDSM